MIERIEVNLLPAEYRIHSKSLRLTRDVVYSALGLIVLFIGVAAAHVVIHSRIDQLDDEIDYLDRSLRQNAHIQREINSLRRDNLEIADKIVALERINVNREKWVRLMEMFSRRLPKLTYLVSLREEPGSRLRIEGRTYVFPEVANYMSSLKEEDYISSIELSDIEINRNSREYRFVFVCQLDSDAMLSTAPKKGVQ